MPDPLEALRAPVEPVDPDSLFAARLRSQLELVLSRSKEVTLTVQARQATAGVPVQEEVRHGDVGYVSLWVPDEDRARRFFSAVLGWPESGHRVVDWGAVGHGFAGGVEYGTLFLCYGVDDLASALERVSAAGGEVGEQSTEPWGPTAMCSDNQGLSFALYELPASGRGPRLPLNGERHGDVSYITMGVVDSGLAREFYSEVLGWRFEPGRVEDGWGPVDVAPMVGLHGGEPRMAVVPMYRVDDVNAAVERVRIAGGTATDPEQQPYGWSSVCEDDQGTHFFLGEH